VGHLQVGEHQVGTISLDYLNRFFTVPGVQRLDPNLLEQRSGESLVETGIIDNKDRGHVVLSTSLRD
jgi:hypothetical protein